MTTLEQTSIAVTDLLEVSTDLTTEENPEGEGGLQPWSYASAAAGVMVQIGITIIIIICVLRRRPGSSQRQIPCEEDRDAGFPEDRDAGFPLLSLMDHETGFGSDGSDIRLENRGHWEEQMSMLPPMPDRDRPPMPDRNRPMPMPPMSEPPMPDRNRPMPMPALSMPPMSEPVSEPMPMTDSSVGGPIFLLMPMTNLPSGNGKSGTERSSARQTSGYLDHLGGELSIPAHNVNLSIPPGALEDREEISIEVFTDLPSGINLQDNEIAASFGFRCFPSGLRFKEPLTISMPHCAVIDDNEVVEMVLHFGRDDEGEIMRIPLETNTYVIHSDSIVLQLDHFSWGLPTFISNWWNSGGNAERQTTKRMLCTPFIPKTLPKDQDHSILRVCVYNELPGLSEKILEEEESMNYKKIYPEEELIVKEDSVDMSISCKSGESPSSQTKVTAKKMMQCTKLTESLTLFQRRSSVTLIITQEHETIMKFWTDTKDEKGLLHSSVPEVASSVGEVEGIVTPVHSLQLGTAPPRSPHTRNTREELHGALVPYVPTQEVESTQQGALRYQRGLEDLRSLDPDCLTDDQLVDISSKLPLDKFNPIAIKLGSSMTETVSIRSTSNRAEEMYFTVLTRWKERTGAPKRQLIDVLRSVKLMGIVKSMGLEHDSSQEDVESIC